jgi:hypothetical protein
MEMLSHSPFASTMDTDMQVMTRRLQDAVEAIDRALRRT